MTIFLGNHNNPVETFTAISHQYPKYDIPLVKQTLYLFYY